MALVTGGARRIGKELALGLARKGFDVAVHFRDSRRDAELTVARIRALGRHSLALRADLCRVSEIEGMFAELTEHFTGLHLLVNNASSFFATKFGETREVDFDELVGSNFKAPFFCAQFAAALMQSSLKHEGPGGPFDRQIVNILDSSAFRPWATHLPYCASKAALGALTHGLARALAPAIRVNAIAPGPMLFPEDMGERARRQALEQTLLLREGSPEDVVSALLFLVEKGRYCTGTVLHVDGGQSWSS